MTRNELIKDIKASTGSGFITRIELARYLGMTCPKGTDKYLRHLQRIDNKYYFIPDVVESLLMHGGSRK